MRVDDEVLGQLAQAHQLGVVVVEGQTDARHIGEVGGDVPLADLDLAVLHVLRVNEEDVLEEVVLLEQGGADEAVEVGPGDEAETLAHTPVVGSPTRRLNFLRAL